MIIRRLLAGSVLLGSVLLPGCASGAEPDCAALVDGDAGAAGRTAVLLDVSASTGATETSPDYVEALQDLLSEAVDREDEVAIGVFDGSAATVRWIQKDVVTRSDANQPGNQQADREDALACINGWLAEAAVSSPRESGTDVLGAIKTAAAYAASLNQPAGQTVVLATDGLSTTGCANLALHPIGESRLIDEAVASCPHQSDWPSELAGVDLYMVGVGRPAATQTVPQTGHLEWIRQFWTSICHEAEAASCDVDTAPIGEADRSRALDGYDDPEVSYATDVVYLLPEEVLFDTASADVRPEGRTHLIELAVRLPSDGSLVEVVGHADSRGEADYNQQLSQRRAESVAEILQAEGIAMLPPRGEGAEQLLCQQERRADGGWDEECLQRNRRVEIRVTEGSAGTR